MVLIRFFESRAGNRQFGGSKRAAASPKAHGKRWGLRPPPVFRFFRGGVGPEIADFGPLPGPARPRRGSGKAPAGVPLDLLV